MMEKKQTVNSMFRCAVLIGALAGMRAETISTTYIDLKGKTRSVTATTITDNTTTTIIPTSYSAAYHGAVLDGAV